MTSRPPMQQEGLALQALSVALQHPRVAANQRNICTLLQVNKPCRAAVQHSATSNAKISLLTSQFGYGLGKLADMTVWLSRHAGLVSTLKIGEDMFDPDRDLYRDSYDEYSGAAIQTAGKQLVEFALQVAATAAASDSGRPLRLCSFTSMIETSAGVLATLPASTLTSLDIKVGRSDRYDGLSKLSNLRQLSLYMFDVTADRFDKYICPVGNLKELTQLKLHAVAVHSNMQLLPAQLQELELDFTRNYSSRWSEQKQGGHCVVSLQHLTTLLHLKITTESLPAGSSVPGGLQSLVVDAQWPVDSLLDFSSLQQVTSVVLNNKLLSKDHCAALQRLGQLKELSLTVSNHEDVSQNLLEVAAAWHSLPLCYLKLKTESMTATEMQQLMQHVAAGTMLTKLHVSVRTVPGAYQSKLAICEHLKTLKNLRGLAFSVGKPSDFVEQDAQHLSALVALTELKLCRYSSGPFLDALALSLLAVSLTGLRVLSFETDRYDRYDHYDGYDHYDRHEAKDRIGILSAVPVIGRLTTLEKLRLSGFNTEHAKRGLEFLTGLSRLTALEGFYEAGHAAQENFWKIIKQHQQRHA